MGMTKTALRFTPIFFITVMVYLVFPVPALALLVQYDTTFSSDGYEIIDNRPATSYEVSYAIAVQSDGKSIIVGSELTLGGTVKRFNADGSIDTTFGNSGTADFTLGSAGTTIFGAVEVQSDGKIVVAGYISSKSTALAGWDYDGVVLRLTSSGQLDTTFSGNGYEIFDAMTGTTGLHDHFYDIALTADGKVVLVGDSSVSAVVVRLTSGGALDTNFSGDGIFSQSVAGVSGKDVLSSVVVDSSGAIFATGYTDTAASNPDAVVMKLTDSGTLATTFDSDGYAIFDAMGGPSNSFDYGKMILLDGTTIVFAGTLQYSGGNTGGFMARLLANGSLDTSFSSDGKYPFSGQDWPEAITSDDDFYYVVGSDYRESIGPSDPSLWRFNKDGTLDTSFDVDGQLKLLELNPFTTTWGILYGVEVVDGQIYLVGSPYDDTTFAELTVIARIAFGNQAVNIPSGTGLTDTSGSAITIPLSGTQVVQLQQTSLGVPVVEFSANFTSANIDLSGVSVDSSIVEGKAVVHGLVGTHTIFVPKRAEDNTVIICPDATILSEVQAGCTNQMTLSESDPNVDVVTIGGQVFWRVSGLTGTGGVSTFVAGATLTPTGQSLLPLFMLAPVVFYAVASGRRRH
jgi:uncharacterized delta-60 repeat protein